MTKYLNLAGKAGVDAFEIHPQSITVRFLDQSEYLYSYLRPGQTHVEKMKQLAISGKGLTTYINVNIRDHYQKKIK